jgi:hypothetical protein
MSKGIIFTLDMLIGLTLLIAIVLGYASLRFESTLPEKRYERLNSLSDDIITVLSNLEVNDIRNKPTISRLISDNVIKEDDMDKSALDLITSFWYAGNTSIAFNISEEILGNLTEDVCVAIRIEDQDIYSPCSLIEEDISVSSRIETGYDVGLPTYGYIARAFLTGIKNKITSSYTYFGGYEGDGNLTKMLELPSDAVVTSVYMELYGGNNFTLYVNGNFTENYSVNNTGMRSSKWQLCNSTVNPNYCSFFTNGNNTVQLNFTNDDYNFIGGGFIKVTYNTSQMSTSSELFNQTKVDSYQFPGIQGIVNLYSSFYVPGTLNGMEMYLHYKNNYTTFLNIGNVTVLRDNSTNEKTTILTNQTLSGLLDYQHLSNKTIPVRMGTEAFEVKSGNNADVILITDASGSMGWKLNNTDVGTDNDCDSITQNSNRISLARCLDKEFIEIVLNNSGNRVGLVEYSGVPSAIPTSNSNMIRSTHVLSNNKTSLDNRVDLYTPNGATGICGALRQARKMLQDQSNSSRRRFIVLMTDGLANVQCSPTNPNSTTGCIPRICPTTSYCTGGGCLYSQCGDWVSNRASDDATQESCYAGTFNMTVYTIGFGPVSSCPLSNSTLTSIANCGNGQYYSSSNATELQEIYRRIAGDIVKISYETQIANISGNVSLENRLYPDSYIEFNYTPTLNPLDYGEIILSRETNTAENMIGYNSTQTYIEGGYFIPAVVKVVDAKITSYSSEYWTDRLYVKDEGSNWMDVYQLGYYGTNYHILGDPFIVQIPAELVKSGENNYVRIGTGLAPTNITGGSPDDRVIYRIVVKGVVGYGNAFETSEEAITDAMDRLISQIGGYVDVGSGDIKTEEESIGGIQWLWGPSLLKIMVWEK